MICRCLAEFIFNFSLHNTHITHLKVQGKKRALGRFLHFFRYLTGELSMISGLFFWRPFVKIFIFRFTNSISRFRITLHFTGNFPEISRNFLQKFSENSRSHIIPRIHPPILYTHTQPPTPWTHLELQLRFSRKYKNCASARFLPCTCFHM